MFEELDNKTKIIGIIVIVLLSIVISIVIYFIKFKKTN